MDLFNFSNSTLVYMFNDIEDACDRKQQEIFDLREELYQEQTKVFNLQDEVQELKAAVVVAPEAQKKIEDLIQYQTSLQEKILELRRLYVSKPLDRPMQEGTFPMVCLGTGGPKIDKIGAIKILRIHFNMGLKECKDFVEGQGSAWAMTKKEMDYLNEKLKEQGYVLKEQNSF